MEAYSKAFDFVEVNSTYYELPRLDTVRYWRSVVPENFEFSVRCNRALLEKYSSTERSERGESLLTVMEHACRVLRAGVLSVLLKNSNSDVLSGLDRFLSDFHSKRTRVAVEWRGSRNAREAEDLVRVLEKNDAIHSVDLSKSETPLVESGVLYSRLFGRGVGNTYEFDDAELKQIIGTAKSPKFEKSILAFHGVRMYRDAARLKSFDITGEFPRLTENTGLEALQRVLEEDAVFPASGMDLVRMQGWKLFDLDSKTRARTGTLLEKLPPDHVFSNPIDVREALEKLVASQIGVSPG